MCLFGEPLAITANIAQLRPNAKNADYFHAFLDYEKQKVTCLLLLLVLLAFQPLLALV
ncbi:hypothetical protein [Pseudomonas aeruginosa]|uniref:hypothetical protein n=1 Tax=Pseudomonas aeruginosa TaxID=287 RepID=UPI003857510A